MSFDEESKKSPLPLVSWRRMFFSRSHGVPLALIALITIEVVVYLAHSLGVAF